MNTFELRSGDTLEFPWKFTSKPITSLLNVTSKKEKIVNGKVVESIDVGWSITALPYWLRKVNNNLMVTQNNLGEVRTGVLTITQEESGNTFDINVTQAKCLSGTPKEVSGGVYLIRKAVGDDPIMAYAPEVWNFGGEAIGIMAKVIVSGSFIPLLIGFESFSDIWGARDYLIVDSENHLITTSDQDVVLESLDWLATRSIYRSTVSQISTSFLARDINNFSVPDFTPPTGNWFLPTGGHWSHIISPNLDKINECYRVSGHPSLVIDLMNNDYWLPTQYDKNSAWTLNGDVVYKDNYNWGIPCTFAYT